MKEKNQFLQNRNQPVKEEDIKKLAGSLAQPSSVFKNAVRQIVIKTDGDSITVEKDETIGGLEFEMILTKILKRLIQ